MEGKPLKRSWARVSAVLWYLGLGLSVVVSGFFGGWLEKDFGLPAFEIGMFGLGLMLLSVVLWHGMSRCPRCGKRGGARSWIYRKTYCSRCGHVLPFDDGPIHEEETSLDRRARFRLRRGRARLILALMIAGLACMVTGGLVFELLMPRPQNEEELWNTIETVWAVRDAAAYAYLAGIVLLIAAGVLTRRRLRCPGCGQGLAAPWQGRGQVRWCGRCGGALAFEDEL